MEVFTKILVIVQVVVGVVLAAIILFQSGKSAGLSGAIAGAADSFMSKGKSRSIDDKLARATKWVAGTYVLLTLVTVILIRYIFKS